MAHGGYRSFPSECFGPNIFATLEACQASGERRTAYASEDRKPLIDMVLQFSSARLQMPFPRQICIPVTVAAADRVRPGAQRSPRPKASFLHLTSWKEDSQEKKRNWIENG